MSISGQNIIVMPVSGLKSNRRAGGDSLLILAPSGALSKKPPLQTKLSGGSMSQDGKIIHELVRGEKSRKVFLQEILDVLSFTGGEFSDAR